MSLVKSNQFCNVSGVTFAYTPAGGSLITVNLFEIEDITFKFKGTELLWGGDAAPGPTRKKVVDRRHEFTIVGADLYTLESIPAGQLGTLTYIEEDFYNGSSTGAITHVVSNFSFHELDTGGKHNDVKKVTAMGSAVWTFSGGVYTSPIVTTQAP